MVFHQGESALQFAEAPQEAWERMRHYAASVAYDRANMRFALTCPVGSVIACWDAGGKYAGLDTGSTFPRWRHACTQSCPECSGTTISTWHRSRGSHDGQHG